MGKNPEWNHEWTINVESVEDQVEIRLWDDSDELAFAFIKVSAFMCNNEIEDWHKLYNDTKVGGRILISSYFTPVEMNGMGEVLTLKNQMEQGSPW